MVAAAAVFTQASSARDRGGANHQGAADAAALVADRGGDPGDVGLALPEVDRVAQAADLGNLVKELLDGGQRAGRGRLQHPGRL
jgi:hypothetical protein